jgi:hypothetical protein
MKVLKNKKRKTFWSLYHDGVTQSLITKWLYCPKQCELEYFYGFVSAKQAAHFIYGNIVHHALQRMYEKNEYPLPGNILCWIKEYDEIIGNYAAEMDIQEENLIHFVRAEVVLQVYAIAYKKDFDLDWVFTEEEIDIPYTFDDGRTIRLRGKLDACHRHKVSKKLWLMDHKNLSRFNVETVTGLLKGDFQVWFYLYCCYLKHGEVPAGFKYNILRVPNIKIDGRKKESVDEYKLRLYNDVLKRSPHYFKRIRVLVTEKELITWHDEQLKPILTALRVWWDTGFKFPGYYNPVNLETKYGKSSLADFILHGDMTGLTKKTRPFMELDA